jgi:hypothetical protein
MKYWIAVASRDHVLCGVSGGFAQVCHGKGLPLKRMKPGDWIVYYSPVVTFGEKKACQAFTAVGKVTEREPYQFQMSPDFVPFRRDIEFVSCKETPIHPMIEHISFIKDKSKWGFPFRRGCFAVSEGDFNLISSKMNVQTK